MTDTDRIRGHWQNELASGFERCCDSCGATYDELLALVARLEAAEAVVLAGPSDDELLAGVKECGGSYAYARQRADDYAAKFAAWERSQETGQPQP